MFQNNLALFSMLVLLLTHLTNISTFFACTSAQLRTIQHFNALQQSAVTISTFDPTIHF